MAKGIELTRSTHYESNLLHFVSTLLDFFWIIHFYVPRSLQNREVPAKPH